MSECHLEKAAPGIGIERGSGVGRLEHGRIQVTRHTRLALRRLDNLVDESATPNQWP